MSNIKYINPLQEYFAEDFLVSKKIIRVGDDNETRNRILFTDKEVVIYMDLWYNFKRKVSS